MDAPTQTPPLSITLMGREVDIRQPKPEQLAAVRLAVGASTMDAMVQYQVVFNFIHALLADQADRDQFALDMATGEFALADVLDAVQSLADKLNGKEPAKPAKKAAARKRAAGK